MDSTDFTTALTRAQQAGIGKDEFLKIWDMEAQLRLVREQAKRCGQQEGKLQKSMGFTERNINNATEGNHSTFENSTQETRMSPDLLKGREKSEDLTKNLPCPGKDAAVNVNTDVSLQTYKLKEDFEQVRKELAEEMRQLKEEVKSLKDNILSEKCQENGHEKFCSEIREQKQELAGLREDVRQWRKEFVELKEILFTMNGKLEQAAQAKKTRASLAAASSSSEDVTAVTANDIVSDSSVTDGNQTCRSDDGREENKDCSHAKPENTGKQDNVSEEAQSPSLNNQKNDEQNGQSRLQKEQQLPQLQNSQENQQQQLKQTYLHKLQQKQSQQQQQQQQQQQPDAQKYNKAVGKKLVLTPQTGIFSKYFAVVKDHSLNGDIPYLPKNGAILEVTDIDQAVAGKEPMTLSPFYRLPNSSTAVRLWIRFTSIRKLNVQLLIFDLKEQSARDICFTVSGELKDFTSQGYNWFFHGSKGIVQYLGPYVNVHASVCLRTSKGLYDNVSIGVLKQKERYILDNSLFIRWFVKSEKLP